MARSSQKTFKITRSELLGICKEFGLKNYSKLKKKDLLKLVADAVAKVQKEMNKEKKNNYESDSEGDYSTDSETDYSSESSQNDTEYDSESSSFSDESDYSTLKRH